MKLVFGLAADGRVYPEAPEPGGAVDGAIVGPAGLIDLLEGQLGLLGPVPSRAVRIAAYLAKLRGAGAGRFWAGSFKKDPWSTAGTLLAWRDELVAGGWQGSGIGAARVDDLAAAEGIGANLPGGLPDRARAVMRALAKRGRVRVEVIRLAEPRNLLPPLWASLIEAMEIAGVAVMEHDGRAAAAEGSDLRRVQEGLSGSSRECLRGDGTFVILEADTALMATEAVADWLAAGPKDVVVLAPDGDTALLDRALSARGLPALGLSSASPWRGALQVLPLAFALAWRPFDPRVLLNLLMLPRPPLPRWAARRLARALASEPGVGGGAWTDAWAAIEARLLEIHAALGPDQAQAKARAELAAWRAWTEGGRFDRRQGMPAAEVHAIAGRVAAWAVKVDGGQGDPLFRAVAGAAGAVSEAVERLEQDVLPGLLLERIVTQVLAEGVSNPTHQAQAGALRAVRSTGALWSSASRLVWWGFVGPGEAVSSGPWDRAELAALAAAGVMLEEPAAEARRITASYSAVLEKVGACVVLVRPALSGEDQTTAHPLAHQLRPLLDGSADGVVFRAERLLREPDAVLAGRTLSRRAVDTVDPPQCVATWTLPANSSRLLEGRSETATSLKRLLNCQLGWFAHDVLGVRAGRFADIPGPDQLFGNLAHEIARRLLTPGPPPPLAGIRQAAAELFEELLPQMAALLQQPEHAGELAAARALVPAALESLVRLLHERGVEIVGAELDRRGRHGALALHGRIDLLVRRGSEVAVLDLKWTKSERRYSDEIADGSAVQLAVYHALAAADGTAAPGGYFLLRQRRVVAGAGSFLTDDPIESDQTDADTLAVVAQDWAAWRGLAASGVVLAAGLPESAASRPDVLGFGPPEEPCRFCELTGLCRVNAEAL